MAGKAPLTLVELVSICSSSTLNIPPSISFVPEPSCHTKNRASLELSSAILVLVSACPLVTPVKTGLTAIAPPFNVLAELFSAGEARLELAISS